MSKREQVEKAAVFMELRRLEGKLNRLAEIVKERADNGGGADVWAAYEQMCDETADIEEWRRRGWEDEK